MKAIILAAGISKRLRPLTNNTPKCLLTINNLNILQLTLNSLIENNISSIIIVTGYLQEQIINFVKTHYPQLQVTFIYNELYESTNNIYSLWLAKSHVLEDDILLLDSDIVFEKNIISELINSQYPNCLALESGHQLSDEEIKVKVKANTSNIIEISKEVFPDEAIGESIGIEKFSKSTIFELFNTLDRIILEDKNVNTFYETAFEELIKNGTEIHTVDVSKYNCIEIDTADDLHQARILFS
jgi:choline kinase